MKLSPRQRQGRRGEDQALTFLTRQGLELILRNYRCRMGELDLVMRDSGDVVIVEVRRRARADYGDALASVGPDKQRRIIQAARHLLMTRPDLAECTCRFDIVGITQSRPPEWICDAFPAF
jgi:putative endonuclease